MLYLDIETDGLDPTVIHCVGYAINNEPATVTTSRDELIRVLGDVSTVVAHNGIAFDFWWLERLWGIDFSRHNLIDTLLYSRLLEPDRKGGHSLDAWGQRLRFPKQDFNDWSQYSEQMAEYCKNDVELLRCLYKALRGPISDFGDSVDAEHKVAVIVAQQSSDGFLLDKANAESLWVAKVQRMNQIEADLQRQFPPIVTERYSTKTGKRLNDNVEVFNVGSRQQIAKRLETVGAVFTEKTETGQAVVNEKTLAALSMPEADLVLEYLTLQKHTGLLSSWIDAAGSDNRVRGYVNTLGAVTGRMTHSRPNMAQIPSDEEFRRLWTVSDGNVLVGIDASGLELRMLAHYMNDDAYTEQLLSGDIHEHNKALAGLATRNQAKTFISMRDDLRETSRLKRGELRGRL
jgi:DNA polymerase I